MDLWTDMFEDYLGCFSVRSFVTQFGAWPESVDYIYQVTHIKPVRLLMVLHFLRQYSVSQSSHLIWRISERHYRRVVQFNLH
jgi:hypothetical protein